MMNLEKCQAIYNGNIDNVQHTAEMKQGSFVNLGAKAKDDVYTVGVPATATLATAEVLVVFGDEISAEAGKNISSFVNPANKPVKAYHMSTGDGYLIAVADVNATVPVAVGKFLSPANGTVVPTVTVAKVATGLVHEITEIDQVIGYGRQPAIRVALKQVL